MAVVALLVGVCDYSKLPNCPPPLPMCKNDLFAVRLAMMKGLNVDIDNIHLCGGDQLVTLQVLQNEFEKITSLVDKDDTFIFYFSGHGCNGGLALSDRIISLEQLINFIDSFSTKNKVVILDSCHSGDFLMKKTAEIDISKTVDAFSGHGCAVLASCGASQTSGFNSERKISVFTSFVCDAFMSNYTISEGKKSLEAIVRDVFWFSERWNNINKEREQQPVVRANIGGTIFFPVKNYKPYKSENVYEETEDYIIYGVKPCHNVITKRLVVFVILKRKSSYEQIAKIATRINQKALHYEVYINKRQEDFFKNKPANIIWCYFGYDEQDIKDGNPYVLG